MRSATFEAGHKLRRVPPGRSQGFLLHIAIIAIVCEPRVGTSPPPVMATRLIVPEEQLLVGTASFLSTIQISRTAPARQRQALVDPVIDTAAVIRELLVAVCDAELI